MTRVIKIGGNEMNAPGYLWDLAQQAAKLAEDEGQPPVIVHGGGQDIAMWQTRLELPTVKVDGLRVTDAESLIVAQMVLSGHTNKQIVKEMLGAGLTAVGLSGVDGGLLRCHKRLHPTADLGLVGEIESVNTELLTSLLEANLTLVISPISSGVDGLTYNVNADEVAGAIARALGAETLDYVSNVPGVLNGTAILSLLTGRSRGVDRLRHHCRGHDPQSPQCAGCRRSGCPAGTNRESGRSGNRRRHRFSSPLNHKHFPDKE
ncbi:MAG: acetylglutamate kinase [Chloroflexota bacterium]